MKRSIILGILLVTLCGPSIGLAQAPAITQQPADRGACSGGDALFIVVATGEDPLTYQWQKDQVDLANGGHYSGVTTATLTITGVNGNDVASYRCVVTNGLGSVTSDEAALTLNGAGFLTNGKFEASAAGNPPLGWTTYIQPAKSGDWTIQTLAPPQGSQWHQTKVYNFSCFGGIRQSVTGLTSGVTYTISGSYKTNSTAATAAVRYNLSGNTDRMTSTVMVSTSATNWGDFSADVTATGASLMLFLDHLNSGTESKASGFDNIKVLCKP